MTTYRYDLPRKIERKRMYERTRVNGAEVYNNISLLRAHFTFGKIREIDQQPIFTILPTLQFLCCTADQSDRRAREYDWIGMGWCMTWQQMIAQWGRYI